MSDTAFVEVLGHPVLQRAKVTYVSCRAPNHDCVLLARCQDDSLVQTIQRLHQREEAMLKEIGADFRACGHAKTCQRQRSCLYLSFLPEITRESEAAYVYSLKHGCIDFERTVRLRDIVDHYYVKSYAAYRVAVGLLVLVNWLVRMRIAMPLTIDNLLIDLNAALLAPIDWSRAQVLNPLPTAMTVIYYRQFARIVLRLMNAQLIKETDTRGTEHRYWKLPEDSEIPESDRFLQLLQEALEQTYAMPDELDRAIDYVNEIYEKQQNLFGRLLKCLHYDQDEMKQPLYELVSKTKIKEG